jgi:protocatechuate 3,4-dioxygenase, alpha subunit
MAKAMKKEAKKEAKQGARSARAAVEATMPARKVPASVPSAGGWRQTASQTVGPFFAYGLVPTQYNYGLGHAFPSLFDGIIAGDGVEGEAIELVGKVYDGAGEPIPDALIEILQADSRGRYARERETVLQTGFRGFGRVGTGTDAQREFRFRTVKPGATGDGQAPHLDVIVLMRGLLVHAYTRVYFEDEPANATDPVLLSVPAARRKTLLARREPIPGKSVYRFDIRMQGADETVFFDV